MNLKKLLLIISLLLIITSAVNADDFQIQNISDKDNTVYIDKDPANGFLRLDKFIKKVDSKTTYVPPAVRFTTAKYLMISKRDIKKLVVQYEGYDNTFAIMRYYIKINKEEWIDNERFLAFGDLNLKSGFNTIRVMAEDFTDVQSREEKVYVYVY